MTAADEPVEVVDEHGTVERLVTRAEMRAGNLRHRSVAVVVLTSAGELVAHRRADWKDVWPGRWDVCFGGVTGVGEAWRDAGCRELAEEAGVRVDPSTLREMGRGTYADDAVSTYFRVYQAVHDGPFRPADGEVAELVLVPLAAVERWAEGRPLCEDSRAFIVPLIVALARGDAPVTPDDDGG